MACPQISRQLGGSTTLENSRVLHDINLLMTANITNERTQRAAIPELIRSDNLDGDHENNDNDVRGGGGGGGGRCWTLIDDSAVRNQCLLD